MTVEQAIEEVRRAGSLKVVAGAIHYEIRKRGPETANALGTLKARKSEALAMLSGPAETTTEPLESTLKGRAIELWSSSAGRLLLVADQDDAQQAMECFGARRGEIYTAGEARRIIAVNDSPVVVEIHEWKRRFDGTLREHRKT